MRSHRHDGEKNEHRTLKSSHFWDATWSQQGELMLWMLEAGHTPQFLAAHLNSDADIEAAAAGHQPGSRKANTIWPRNCNARRGRSIARQWNAGCSTTARAEQLRGRLRRLNQAAQRSDLRCNRERRSRVDHRHCTAQVQADQRRPSTALLPRGCPALQRHRLNRPWPKPQKPRRTGLVRDHWHNILQSSPHRPPSVPGPAAACGDRSQRSLQAAPGGDVSSTICCSRKRFLTHLGQPTGLFNSASDAAAAFWQHDPAAEALLSPEINPLIWSDFRSGSGLQQAARYWLVQKLFHGRCLLEAINIDGGIPLETMKQRCSSSFDPDFYWTQRARMGQSRKK